MGTVDRSFYEFVLTFRGAVQQSPVSHFAEAVFRDQAFPKHEKSFHRLSAYIEEALDERMQAAIFDELFEQYEERYLNDLPILPLQNEE